MWFVKCNFVLNNIGRILATLQQSGKFLIGSFAVKFTRAQSYKIVDIFILFNYLYVLKLKRAKICSRCRLIRSNCTVYHAFRLKQQAT